MLRADTAAAAHVDGTHDQKLYTVDILAEGIGDIRNIGIQLVKLVGGGGTGALLHQSAHFGDGDNGIHFVLSQAKGQTQVGIRIHIGGQDGTSLVRVEPGQRGGQSGFTHAALAGNRYFHWKKTSL